MKQFIFKTLKVIYNFQAMCNYYPHATVWKVIKWKLARTVRNVTILASFVVVGGASAMTYNRLHPITVWAEKITQVEVPVETDIPILNKIINCESGGKQLDKNGQINVNINVQQDGTKSIDIGIGQINVTVWGATASKMGYDLTKESDNRAFTKWLFLNKGSAPWSASQKCWQK